MVVVEPVITQEKLSHLLAEGNESPQLDYKRVVTFEKNTSLDTRSRVELAKDIGAMQADGGYIVIGADNQGNPSGEITLSLEDLQKCFDEAKLYAQLKKWIPEPFDIRTAVHELRGKVLALIYVAARPEGFCIFRAVGDYPGGTAFRTGEVYVRHGTASEPWHQHDIQRILDHLIERKKEEWRKELSDEFRVIILASQAQTLARGPAASFSWQLDEAPFGNVVLELLRANDDIPLRTLLNESVRDARLLVDKPGSEADVAILIDRLTCLSALTGTHERWTWTESAVKALENIYNLGFDSSGQSRRLNGLTAPRLWLSITERIMALGAMFVRQGAWDAVRMLVRRPRQDGPFVSGGDVSWIRHGSAEGAHAGLFAHIGSGSKAELSLIEMARVHVRAHPCLRPDVDAESDSILDSLCQFDFLAGITAIADAKRATNWEFYPSFARFNSHRTIPAVARLIQDSDMRSKLFPLGDDDLATALTEIDASATRIGLMINGWEGFRDKHITEFIRKHLPAKETT